MATTTSPQLNSNAFTGMSSSATVSVSDDYITGTEIKEHIDEKMEEIKKAVVREGDNELMQDLVDLTRVMIEEMRGLRSEIGLMSSPVYPQQVQQVQPQHTHQLAGQMQASPYVTTSSGTGQF